MKISNIINKLNVISILLLSMYILVSCSTIPRPSVMDIVEQNLNESRLVPRAAVQQLDILNLYSHEYAKNKNIPIDIDITLDKTKVLNTGGNGFVQIALLAQPAIIKKSEIQFLIYDGSLTDKNKKLVSNIVEHSKKYVSSLANGSQFSVDSSFKRDDLFVDITQNHKHHNPTLIDFVKLYSKQHYPEMANQIVFILGDIGKMLKTEKQDVIDMTRILSAKGVRTSVLSYGESPDFSFYSKIAEVGNGFYRINKEKFNYTKWLKNEITNLHAFDYSNLKVSIKAKNNLFITSILSPNTSLGNNNNYDSDNISFKFDKFSEGSQFIMLAKVSYPKLKGKPSKKIITVSIDYFDNKDRKYKRLSVDKYINYVFEKNELQSNINTRIKRSKLILKTKSVINDIEPMIKGRRYYKAIALLTTQQQDLKKYLVVHSDNELSRDVSVLEKYSKKLYNFDDEFIQFWQINNDLNWDNARFDYRYQ